MKTCPNCQGKKMVVVGTQTVTCPGCLGEGKILTDAEVLQRFRDDEATARALQRAAEERRYH